MRMLKVDDCEYEQFYEMRKQILNSTPFAVLNIEYLKEEKVAFFYFWDSDYIPKEWEKWIVRSAKKMSKEKGVSEEYD